MHERSRINLELGLCISLVVGSALLVLGCSELEMTKRMAESGDAEAQYELGLMYAFGEDVAEDKTEAMKWWRKAAEQGDAFSQHNLGSMYDNGVGVAEDDVEAVKWYRKAAEQGVVWSQFNLGAAYRVGEGVARDPVRAHMWTKLASSQGSEGARATMKILEKEMTQAQIAQAERMAGKWLKEHLSKQD